MRNYSLKQQNTIHHNQNNQMVEFFFFVHLLAVDEGAPMLMFTIGHGLKQSKVERYFLIVRIRKRHFVLARKRNIVEDKKLKTNWILL